MAFPNLLARHVADVLKSQPEMASKRTVLVTGCSDGGLGAEICLAFHRNGWRVFATARNVAKMKIVAAAGIETIPLDITSNESIIDCVNQVSKLTGGKLNMLLNNAGVGCSVPLLDLDQEQFRKTFDTNVYSIIPVTKHFLPLLRASGKGIVVNNTSVGGVTIAASPMGGTYYASKSAAITLTDVMRLELEPFGIRVVNLMTGAVKSGFFDNAPNISLPADSLYNVAKDAVQKAMSGANDEPNKSDAGAYAKKVVKALSKSDPPVAVWAGGMATVAWIASWLPVWAIDGMRKKAGGLDVVEANLKAGKGVRG